MKLKLILGLALVLGGGLFGCSKAEPKINAVDADARSLPEAVRGEIWNKTLLTNWTDTKITLYRATGEVAQLDAKKAMYRIWTTNNWAHTNSSIDTAVVVFIDPKSEKVWLGSAAMDKDSKILDFYVESDVGIFSGADYVYYGEFDLQTSLITKVNPGENVSAVIDRFEKNVNGWWVMGSGNRTPVSSYFREWFFYPRERDSFMDPVKIDRVEVADGKLRLDFKSPAYKTQGSIWLDLNTGKVLKAAEDGNRVYPKWFL